MSEGRYIYLVGFGVEKRLLLAVAKSVKEVFKREVRLSHVVLPPYLAYDPHRRQHRAGVLLDFLTRVNYPRMLKLVGLFPFDLYEEGVDFIFGLSRLSGEHGLVGTFRLTSAEERLYFERVCKEVNHELGHTFGLLHCGTPGCVMNPSESPQQVDAKGRFLCEECNKILSKSQEV